MWQSFILKRLEFIEYCHWNHPSFKRKVNADWSAFTLVVVISLSFTFVFDQIAALKIFFDVMFVAPLLTMFFPFEKFDRNLSTSYVYVSVFIPLTFTYYILLTKILNQLIPGKAERTAHVLEYRKTLSRSLRREEIEMEPHKVKCYYNSDDFINEHFQTSGQFKRFFFERVMDNGKIIGDKLLFLLLIPRRKEMPIDHLKQIIIGCNNVKFEISFDERLKLNQIVTTNHVNRLFAKLSDDQIKMIFTRPFDAEDYINLIIETTEPLEPSRTMSELIDSAIVNPENANRRLRHSYLSKIKENKTYNFQVLLSKRDFNRASRDFSNCVKNYHDFSCDVFTVTDFNGNPVACVKIQNHKITEIAGYKNNDVNPVDKSKIKEIFYSLS